MRVKSAIFCGFAVFVFAILAHSAAVEMIMKELNTLSLGRHSNCLQRLRMLSAPPLACPTQSAVTVTGYLMEPSPFELK